MLNLDDVTMHRVNRKALHDDQAWFEDIQRWRDEHRRAKAWLADVQAIWAKAEALLEAHAQSVEQHRRQLELDEQRVSDHEWGRAGISRLQLQAEHQQVEQEHAEIRRAHERLRQHHQVVMAEARELLEVVLSGATVHETLA